MKNSVKQAIVLVFASVISMLFLLYAFKQNSESALIITRLEVQLEECKMEAEKQREVA